MDSKLHILQHTLGLDRYGEGESYRNYFVAGAGSRNYSLCQELTADGLMQEHAPMVISGNSPWFSVTDAGKTFIAANSPAKPKLTRSQKRYREWCRYDGGMTFGDWLKVKGWQPSSGHIPMN